MKVTAHPLPEVFARKHGRLDAAGLRAITHDASRHEEWISTTTTLWNPGDRLVYVGLTQRDGDILYAFDPKTGRATCLDYLSVRVAEEVKVHRSLQSAPDGRIFGASAGLITIRTREEAPGGQIWSYDPRTRRYEVYGIPAPHDYVQHVAVDVKRQMAYGCTYPVPWFFAFDLKARTTRRRAFIGCYPHRSAIDDRGRVWSGWSPSADTTSGEDFLLSYDPDADRLTYHDLQLPGVGQNDRKQIDDMINLGDGYMYISSVNGGLSRLDPEKGKVEWLGKPARGMRLCGIAEGPDGLVYLLTGAFYGMKGDDAATHAWTLDRRTGRFADLGPIFDPDFGDGCAVVHHLSIGADGTLWVGETDNPNRSGCLWECRVS